MFLSNKLFGSQTLSVLCIIMNVNNRRGNNKFFFSLSLKFNNFLSLMLLLDFVSLPFSFSSSDGIAKSILLHAFVLSAAAAALRYRRQRKLQPVAAAIDARPVPKLVKSESGRVEEIESFSSYVGNYQFYLFPLIFFKNKLKKNIFCKLGGRYMIKVLS